MGILDFLFAGPKETRTDSRGNTYEYDLSSKKVKKQTPGSITKFDVGYAESTKEFEDKVKKGKL